MEVRNIATPLGPADGLPAGPFFMACLDGEVQWLRPQLEAELERRRWPGLWQALRRLWWGEG
jgi:hypothetical protein